LTSQRLLAAFLVRFAGGVEGAGGDFGGEGSGMGGLSSRGSGWVGGGTARIGGREVRGSGGSLATLTRAMAAAASPGRGEGG
jgi:hypothetical protein